MIISPEDIDVLVASDFPYGFALPRIGYQSFAFVQSAIMADLGPSAVSEVPIPGRLIEVNYTYERGRNWALWSKLDGIYRPTWLFFKSEDDRDRFLSLIARLSGVDKEQWARENTDG